MHCVAVVGDPSGENPEGQVRRSSMAAVREPSLVGSVQKPVVRVVDHVVHVPAPHTPVSRRYSMVIAEVVRVTSADTLVDGRLDVVRFVVAGGAVAGRVEVTRSVVAGTTLDGRVVRARVDVCSAVEPRTVTPAGVVVSVVVGRAVTLRLVVGRDELARVESVRAVSAMAALGRAVARRGVVGWAMPILAVGASVVRIGEVGVAEHCGAPVTSCCGDEKMSGLRPAPSVGAAKPPLPGRVACK